MTDYIEEYGDEIEDIGDRLRHISDIINTATIHLQQGVAKKAVWSLPTALAELDAIASSVRSLIQSLEWELKQ